jgi:molybdopterin/thiamine biosynthesis adenylyltransferase
MQAGTILLDSEIELPNSGFINMNHAKDMNNLLIIADTTRIDSINIKGAIASKKMLYFDLEDHYRVPFPITAGELHKSIIQAGHKTILQKAYKQKGLYPYLLIGINLPDGKKHYIAYLIEDFLPKTLRGSKSGTFSILTYLSNPMTANRYLSAHRVRHFSKQRVFYRAAGQKGEKMSNNNLSIAIIGCGSVGASLAFKLAKSGFSNILLIDPQLFDIDNTGRHILGLESIGVNKAEATATLLRSQFLDIQVKAIPSHAERHIDLLRDVDIIISAVGGDAPVLEKALCDKSQSGELPPVIACWLEAYAFAGHAVLIDESSTHSIGTIYPKLALLDEEYASTLEEKDAGCNANFMPYSFLEADQHITQFAKMIAQYAQAEKVLPVLTSIGDFNNLIANNLKSNISISPNSILRKSYEEIFTA